MGAKRAPSRKTALAEAVGSALNVANRTLFTGDNLDILRGINDDSVDLVYLDPPFNSNRDYAAPIGSKAAGAAFKDTWSLDDVDLELHGEIGERMPSLYSVIGAAGMACGKSTKAYLIMMAVRLLELKRVLKPTGSIYLHCDTTESHALKMVMDCIFGRNCFRNEIVWKRTSAHSNAKRFGRVHDVILYYTGGGKAVWNDVFQPYDDEYIRKTYRFKDEKGRLHGRGDLTGPGTSGGSSGKAWRGVDPGDRGRCWRLPPDAALPDWFVRPGSWSKMSCQERLDVLDAQGLIHWPENAGGMPRFKRHLSVARGVKAQDLISDVPPVASAAGESTGYPTQKPLKLLERLIEASTREGDVVLDPFCRMRHGVGCGGASGAEVDRHRPWGEGGFAGGGAAGKGMRGAVGRKGEAPGGHPPPHRPGTRPRLPDPQARLVRPAGRALRRLRGPLPVPQHDVRPSGAAHQGRVGPHRKPAAAVRRLQQPEGGSFPGLAEGPAAQADAAKCLTS